MTAVERVSLSSMERASLAREESAIERGIDTFLRVGEALATIRDQRLYRDTHETFADYCRERWGLSDRRVRQLIVAAKTGTTVPIQNENQARALSGLNPDEQRATYQRAREQSGADAPTAAQIKAARPHTPGAETRPREDHSAPGPTDSDAPSPAPDAVHDPIGDAKAEAKNAPARIGSAVMLDLEKAHGHIVRAGGPAAICADNEDLGAAFNPPLWADTLDRLIPLLTEWRRQLRRTHLRGVK